VELIRAKLRKGARFRLRRFETIVLLLLTRSKYSSLLRVVENRCCVRASATASACSEYQLLLSYYEYYYIVYERFHYLYGQLFQRILF
jgi:hypothetical protein